MDEEGNDKLKLPSSANSTPTSNITKLKTVTFFFRIVTGEGMWVHRYSPDKENAIHWREILKISRKWEVWMKKNEGEKDDDSNIMEYSRDHSCWFYAASYAGDCSRYKVLLQRLNSTTVRSSLCLRVLLLHSNDKCVLFTPPLTCCTPGVGSWSHTFYSAKFTMTKSQ